MLVERFGGGFPIECLAGSGVQGVSHGFELFG